MSNIIEISVKTINGQILQFPRIISFRAKEMIPIGEDLVRNFDDNQCIVVTKIFLFLSGSDLFGTTQFSTIEGFFQFINSKCSPNINECFPTIGDCYITIGGCYVSVCGCFLTIDGCEITIDGIKLVS